MLVKRSILVALGFFGLGIAVVLLAGPALFGASASAQTRQAQASATASATPSAQASARPSSAASALRTQFLDRLASELNVSRSALDSAIVAAGSSTLDAAVQQGKLTQAQADALKARLQGGDLGALLGLRGGGNGGARGGRSGGGVQQAMVEAAAQALGLTVDEFRSQLRSGQMPAQLAQAKNTTEQAVINAALAAAKIRLDQAVANGTLTQARADQIYAELQQRGSDLFTGRGRGPGKQGRQGTPASPAPTATPAG